MIIDDLEVYRISLKVGENIWALVVKWDYFAKDTIGKQLVRSVDSISANISEGYGRFHFKEEKRFLYYARGSLFETMTFIKIAYSRKLISDDSFIELEQQIEILGKKLNCFINSIDRKLK